MEVSLAVSLVLIVSLLQPNYGEADAAQSRLVKRDGGTITAAVIGATFAAGSTGVGIATRPDNGYGDKGGCRWIGTAPFCSGHCDAHQGYTQEHRRKSPTNNAFTVATVWGREFGEHCWSGRKALCCKSEAGDNTWTGTWELLSNNAKFRCTVVREGTKAIQHCGAALRCYDDKMGGYRGFIIVGNDCTGLRTLGDANGNGYSCTGTATYGLIRFHHANGKTCGVVPKDWKENKLYKVE